MTKKGLSAILRSREVGPHHQTQLDVKLLTAFLWMFLFLCREYNQVILSAIDRELMFEWGLQGI